jgi:hypothetical protein
MVRLERRRHLTQGLLVGGAFRFGAAAPEHADA